MKRQTLMKSTLCLLMALVCNVAWAQTSADGPIVTFTNVQQDGTTTFTLYINENDELATSSSSAAELGDAAKFRAIPKENGKWAFYNESKGLYMIWRGKGYGHNGDKGVLGEYDATYCDWTMNAGTVSGTYYFVGRRKDNSDDGSLVVMKNNGAFDAWMNSQALAGNYSNLYKIESEEYVATLTDNQGTKITCTTKGLFPLPNYSTVALSNTKWANGRLTATVDAQFPTLPFPLSTAEDTNATFISSFKNGGGGSGPGRFKWYSLDDADDVVAKCDVAATHSTFKNFSWAIYASLENGAFAYSIKNVAKDKYIYSGASYAANNGSHGDDVVTLSDTPTKFKLTTNGDNCFYYVSNNVNQYLSLNSTGTADAQQLGIYAKTHNGTTNSFHTATYDLSSKVELVSGGIYTFVSSKGSMGATEENAKVISTARTTVSDTNTDFFKWTMYQSKNGNYYLYNLGKQQFMGVQTANNTEIDFVDKPAGKTLTFKDNGQTNGYPIMFSTDNAGVVNHSPNHGGGLINWTGGWNKMDDAGSNHKVTYIGELTADQLKTIADLVEAYDKSLPIKVEVEGSWEGNPNTHFGNVTATAGDNVSTTKLTLDHMNVSYMMYSNIGDVVAHARPYRGFDFQGFYAGTKNLGKSFTITEELVNDITAENPLIAKFTATEAVTLFYDDDEFSYRIPAIATTSTGRLIAVSDYRHCLDDIGMNRWGKGYRIDLVMRYSDDNGKTWSNIQTIAEGIDNSQADDCAYGDAAIAVVGNEVIVMAVAGAVQYNTGNAERRSRVVRIYSADNGVNWEKTDITENVYGHEGSLYPNVYTSFFGSGRLAVDPNFNNSGTARIYGSMLTQGQGNIVIYSDDKGLTWNKLGGRVADANEPKIEILPSGQILFSARRNGGRNFNVFTYTDKANGEGTWSNAVDGCDNEGENGTNGETFLIDAQNASGQPVKLLLQSQPVGGGAWDRANVSIWYKEISSDENHNHTPSEIAGGWTKGMQVSHQLSAYSTMSLQEDGRIAFFFEEAPCYQNEFKYGYCMVYLPLTIEEITKNKYFSPDADLTTERAINVVLTDAQGNEYRQQVTSTLGGVATKLTTDYPFITLGDNATLESDGESFTYTNTVTLPFKVSNESATIWHNIYWHGRGDNELVYLYGGDANDGFVAKVAPGSNIPYGNSDYNTAANADNMSWAVYHAGNFTFTLKNKLTKKYIKVTSVANGNSQNAKFVEEGATAFEIVTEAAGQNYKGNYSFKASVDGTVGYLCNTAASYGWATHYNGNGHEGGWATIVEAPDFETLFGEVNVVLNMFGTKLGQYAVVDAVTAAKEAMQNSATVKLNDLNTYKTLLNGATLNMPVAGQFFRIRGISGNYIDASSIYNNANATTGQMSMKSAEACNYAGTIFYLDADKHLLNYATGRYVKETREIGAVGDAAGVWSFAESPRTGKGKYALSCTTTNNNGSHLHDNAGNRADRCSSNCGNRHDFTLEEVTELPVNIGELGYSTLYSLVALSIPKGVTAYTGAFNETETTITLELYPLNSTIPANTAVILKAEEDTYSFNITEKVPAIEGNVLQGTATEIKTSDVTGGVVYTLQPYTGDDETYTLPVVFMQYADENKPDEALVLKAGKAYLVLPADENGEVTKSISIRFGEGTTSIDNGQLTIDNESALIYDLLGRRVEAMTKGGIYIVNGKKVIK